jgi:hypothetical protein
VPYHDSINNIRPTTTIEGSSFQVQQVQFANDTYCGVNTVSNVYYYTYSFVDYTPGTHTVGIIANPSNMEFDICCGDGWESEISANASYTIN